MSNNDNSFTLYSFLSIWQCWCISNPNISDLRETKSDKFSQACSRIVCKDDWHLTDKKKTAHMLGTLRDLVLQLTQESRLPVSMYSFMMQIWFISLLLMTYTILGLRILQWCRKWGPSPLLCLDLTRTFTHKVNKNIISGLRQSLASWADIQINHLTVILRLLSLLLSLSLSLQQLHWNYVWCRFHGLLPERCWEVLLGNALPSPLILLLSLSNFIIFADLKNADVMSGKQDTLATYFLWQQRENISGLS